LIFAVLPVKNPRDAIVALCATRGLDRIAVSTNDDAIARDARRRGALVFEERDQRGHSHSADAAVRHAASLGAKTVLLVPIDVPLVTRGDIEALAAAGPRPGLAIVPSSDGTGTNALVQTPPGVISCRFGPGSFQAHFEQARSRDVPVEVLRPPGLTFDLDTPEDAERLLAHAPSSPLAPLLRHALGNHRSRQPA
jgi:2-phospho-L-lactate guanylyltransferase